VDAERVGDDRGGRMEDELAQRGDTGFLNREAVLAELKVDRDAREPLLDAIAERIRTRMGDRAPRRYLSVLRVGQRAE
jgi:hypothetical protein